MKTNLVQGDYKVFEGPYNSTMPLLKLEAFNPLTAKHVMEYRLKALQGKDEDEIDFWLDHYWDTVSGLAYHSDQLMVIPRSDLLLNIDPNQELSNGSIRLTKDQFNEYKKKYEVIERKKVKIRELLSRKEAKEHPIWIKLAEDDRSLLNDYTDLTFEQAKQSFNYDENMAVYLHEDQKQPALRSWVLSYLVNGSYTYAGDRLYSSTRLCGVRAQNLEQILGKIAINSNLNPQELEKAIKLYNQVKELFT